MNKIEEINALGEQILNQQALTNAKQLGLQACAIAVQLAVENERLTAELEKYRAIGKPTGWTTQCHIPEPQNCEECRASGIERICASPSKNRFCKHYRNKKGV